MRKKVLLMGKKGSGKTSMRSIIFADYIARDTKRIGATIDIEQFYVRFLGNLVLNFWDCGGQEAFMEHYFTAQRDNIFRNVEVLIYVFDVESRDIDKDIHSYQSCLESISQQSPNAKIFVLIHKMDLIPENKRESIFRRRVEELETYSRPLQFRCFQSSIWDETLYKAWSQILHELISNSAQLERSLKDFADVIEADEILLFEKTTFLIISHCHKKENSDLQRFEKISNIIKQFKLSCSKCDTFFQSVEIKNANYTIIIDLFTPNTYIMVVISDPRITPALTNYNIKYAQKYFQNLEWFEEQNPKS
ncbi:unnamed protein product [Brachionus calyciflorus]|uniref:Ras-related GTP-binding protein A n=1 Tax=Brachionus calyciflorus TaxID=104777 RepID=A0A813VSI8_9BILA|nr:unnamed protein product [Brachionus calyciflorus]